MNGDGYSDVIVGAPRFGDGEVDEGAASVFFGSASGLAAAPAWTAQGNQDSAAFGGAVATAGDVNADGYADVIVGASEFTETEVAEGKVFVFYGSATGPGASADWTARGEQSVARFGSAVSTAGDVNGDGYADVIVGADLYDRDQVDEGSIFVFHGGASGLDAGGARPSGTPDNADWRAESDQASASSGSRRRRRET